MPDEQPSAGELQARAALDQANAKLDDLSFHLITSVAARDRVEKEVRELIRLHCQREAELRRQLAESETMRAAVSHDLQLLRAQYDQIRELATPAIIAERDAMEELEQKGCLSDAGREQLTVLRTWVALYVW